MVGLPIDAGGSTGTVDVARLGIDIVGGTLEDVRDSIAEAGRALGPGAVLGRREVEDGAICGDMEERELGRRGSAWDVTGGALGAAGVRTMSVKNISEYVESQSKARTHIRAWGRLIPVCPQGGGPVDARRDSGGLHTGNLQRLPPSMTWYTLKCFLFSFDIAYPGFSRRGIFNALSQ
jgi:hypothetical protein